MKYYRNLKIGWRQSLVPLLPWKSKVLVKAAKNYAKLDVKAFRSCPNLLDFFT